MLKASSGVATCLVPDDAAATFLWGGGLRSRSCLEEESVLIISSTEIVDSSESFLPLLLRQHAVGVHPYSQAFHVPV